METKLRIRYIIRDTVEIVGMGVILFWSVSRMDRWTGGGARPGQHWPEHS